MEKKKVYPRLCVYNLLLMAMFSYWIFLQTACNSSSAQTGQKTSTNWTSVDITFKSNTNDDWREKSIRDIEKMLIKSVTPYTREYKNFYPSITITKMPFWDSLKYRISVLNTYKDSTGKLQLLSKSPTPCPPCPGYCPACDTMMVRVMSTQRISKMVFEQPK